MIHVGYVGHVPYRVHTHTHTYTHTDTPHTQVIYEEGADEAESRQNVSEALEKSRKTLLTEFLRNNLYEWEMRHQERESTPRPRGYELTYSQYPSYYRCE